MKKSLSTLLASLLFITTLSGCEAEQAHRVTILKVSQSFVLTTTQGQKYTISPNEERSYDWEANAKVQNGIVVLYLTKGKAAFAFQIPDAIQDDNLFANEYRSGKYKYRLNSAKASAAQTSQGVGLSIENRYNSRESKSSGVQSCTVTEKASVCENGQCKQVTITRTGYRSADTTSYSSDSFNLVLKKANGSVLMTATIHGLDSSSSVATSSCY